MSEHEQTPLFEGIFFFACVWSLGSVCDTTSKLKFDAIFKHLSTGYPLKEGLVNELVSSAASTQYVFSMPMEGTVFDYKLTIATKPEWSKWSEDIDSGAALPRDIYACQLIIPNEEQAKYNYLMTLLIENSKPFLLVGAPGTGNRLM